MMEEIQKTLQAVWIVKVTERSHLHWRQRLHGTAQYKSPVSQHCECCGERDKPVIHQEQRGLCEGGVGFTYQKKGKS